MIKLLIFIIIILKFILKIISDLGLLNSMFSRLIRFELTRTTESREAMSKISAHETTPGHIFSTSDLIASITSKPLTELLLAAAVFSPWKVGVSSSSIDPSQPCFH